VRVNEAASLMAEPAELFATQRNSLPFISTMVPLIVNVAGCFAIAARYFRWQ
jgi:hypothetical protein